MFTNEDYILLYAIAIGGLITGLLKKGVKNVKTFLLRMSYGAVSSGVLGYAAVNFIPDNGKLKPIAYVVAYIIGRMSEEIITAFEERIIDYVKNFKIKL
jgi:hypothetical protein